MRIFKTAVLTIAGVTIFAAIGQPVAMAQEPPIREDCFVGNGPPRTADGEACRPPDPKHTEAEKALIDAKIAHADAYAAFRRGEIDKQQLDVVAEHFWRISGQEPVEPTQSRVASTPGNDANGAESSQMSMLGDLASFYPFEQYYNWQCGPATAQSILWIKSSHTSAYPPDGSSITGDRLNDQWILGYDVYTNANALLQTPWSGQVVEQTLDRWREGADGYFITAAIASSGGDTNNMTQSNAMAYIVYDIDHDFPLAENVEYSGASYRPAAFPGPQVWEHWDTIYGYFDSAGTRYVQIGQVWGSTRYYNVAWNTHWSAIANQHGIVW